MAYLGPGGKNYHAAVDWFAPPGSVVRAPVTGKVVEVKASRGSSGQVFGGTVKVQDASGRVYVFRHVNPGRVKEGQTISAGRPIGVSNMLDPAQVFGRAKGQKRRR